MSGPPDPSRPRPNPFAFASDTGLRFALLVVLAAAASLRRWFGIGLDLGPQGEAAACAFLALEPGRPMVAGQPRWQALLDCSRAVLPPLLPAIALGLGLLALGTAVLYALHPALAVWRWRLRPLRAEDVPGLAPVLLDLCRRAGLRRPPEVWWNPLDLGPTALAFGRPGRYRVALSGGRVGQSLTDPAAFAAVVLHELAHIRNGDVERAFLALAIWRAFLATALLPYVVIQIVWAGPGPLDVALLLLEALVLGAVVLLARNAVLRARELYADARCLAWHGDHAVMARLLARLRPVAAPWYLLSPHPSPAQRLRLLDSTDALFRLGTGDAFAIGVATGWTAMSLVLVGMMVLLHLGTGNDLGVYAGVVVPAAALALAAATAAIATWRATLLATIRGQRPTGAVRTGLAIATGIVLGGPALLGTVLLATLLGWGPAAAAPALPPGTVLALAAGLVALAIALLSAVLVPFLAWVEACASAWLPVLLRGGRAPPALWIVIAVSAALTVPWMAGLLAFLGLSLVGEVQVTATVDPFAAMYRTALAASSFPISLAAWPGILWIWAFPMAAAAWPHIRRSRRDGEPFLEGAEVPAILLPSPLRIRRAAAIALLGAIPLAVALDQVALPATAEAAQAAGLGDSPRVVRYLSLMVTGMLGQGVVAALVALAVPRLGVVHGLFGAFIAAGVVCISLLLHVAASGVRMTPGQMAEFVVAPQVLGGALVALACAGCVRLLAGVARAVGRLRLATRIGRAVAGSA